MVNVGAGTGSYEPPDRVVVAVEPSAVMLAQRPAGAPPALRGAAEALPLPDGAVDAALAVLTVHHWDDQRAGLAELRRVARRRVVVTYDPAVHTNQWVVRDYVPEIAELEADRLPYAEVIEILEATPMVLPLTRQFADGLLGAFWCRPWAYLDPEVRAHMSGFAKVEPAAVDRGMARLAEDLASGEWARRNADLTGAATFDAGFRLLVSSAG